MVQLGVHSSQHVHGVPREVSGITTRNPRQIQARSLSKDMRDGASHLSKVTAVLLERQKQCWAYKIPV